MTSAERWFAAGATLVLVGVLAGDASAAQGPKKEKRRHQQVIPTGAEDAPAASAPTRTVAPDAGEALIDRITSKDSTDLVQETLSDGSVSVNLQDRFQHVMRVTPNDDGSLSATCRDGHDREPSKKAHVAKAQPATAPRVPEER